MKKLLFVLIILGVSLSACHKNHDDTTSPTLIITAPTDNASVKIGTDVKITGTASDNLTMHEMSIKITQDTDNKELFSAAPTVHEKVTYDINETWKPNVTAETNVTLTVTVIDHSDNKTTKTIKFKVAK